MRNLWLADTPGERRLALDWVRSSYLVYAGLGWGADATGVELNLTTIAAEGSGFATLYPCTTPPPNASSLNLTSKRV